MSHIVAACAIVFALTFAIHAGPRWADAARLLLTDGLLTLAWAVAGTLLGAALLRGFARRRGDAAALDPPLSLLLPTAAGLGLGAIALVTLGLGLAGLLNRPTAIGLLVISAAAGLPMLRRVGAEVRAAVATLARPAGWAWLWVLAMPALAIAVVGACLMPGLLWRPHDPHPYDVVSYHLQVPREWFELGRIVPLRHNMFSFFPFLVEVHYLLLMHVTGGPWDGTYAAQLTSVAYSVLGVMAVVGACRWAIAPHVPGTNVGTPDERRGQPRGDADTGRTSPAAAGPTVAGVAVAVLPWTTMFAAVCFVEAAQLLYVTLAVAWVIGPARRCALAGVLAGLACGVKLTAGPMLLAAVPVGLVVEALARRSGLRGALIGAFVFGAVGLTVFSPWAIRNAAWAGGNPLFPNALRTLGPGHFAPGQVERYEAAHAPRPDQQSLAGRATATWRQLLIDWHFGYAAVPLTAIAVGLAWRRQPAAVLVLVAVLIVQFVFWVGFTHLIARFMTIAVPPAALLVGLADWRRARLVPVACLAGMAVAGVAVLGPQLRAWSIDQQVALPTDGDGLFGLKDLRPLIPPEELAVLDGGGTVHRVGDAQVFWLHAPMKQIRYRTVFDVDPRPGLDPIEAWTGGPLAALGPADAAVVDASEIRRLASTYRHVPDLPPGFPGPARGVFIVRRDGTVIVPEQ